MSQENRPYHSNVHLTFPPSVSGSPLVCNLTRLFDLDFNISTAQITPRQEGFLTLELSGSREACDKGIAYLREKGVRVSPVAQRIWHDENACMQCGMCTALCPTGALTVDVATRLLAFDKESVQYARVAYGFAPSGPCRWMLPKRASSRNSAHGPIAQLVEPPAHNRSVLGSSPSGSTKYIKPLQIISVRAFLRKGFQPRDSPVFLVMESGRDVKILRFLYTKTAASSPMRRDSRILSTRCCIPCLYMCAYKVLPHFPLQHPTASTPFR